MRSRPLLLGVLAAAALCGLAAGGVARAGSAGIRSAAGSHIVFAANRVPNSYGEIYRVTAKGRKLDLSKSPAADIGPSVSPNGRWVAFLSDRNGQWAFYVVGINGRHLRRISTALPANPPGDHQPGIAWASDSQHLAAVLTDRPVLYLGSLSSGLRPVAHDAAWGGLSWSPDGRYLSYSTGSDEMQVLSSTGQRLWSVPGAVNGNAWSSGDRLAVTAKNMVNVYDSAGQRLTSFAGFSPVWSPDGTLLASVTGSALQIRQGGLGAPVWHWPVRYLISMQWVSPTQLRLYRGRGGWLTLDLAHKRVWRLGTLAKKFNSALSASGQILVEQQHGHKGSQLELIQPHRATRTLATGPWCPDYLDFGNLAFVPHGRGVIYQTSCSQPSADIYLINPDGSGLRQITHTPNDELEPSLSPDGQNVVYMQQLSAGFCDGCAQTLWRVPTSGGTPVQLTSHSDQDAAPFDRNPSWSPDGSTIAFDNSGPNVTYHLLTIPAAGGSSSDPNVSNAMRVVWGPQLIAFTGFTTLTSKIATYDPSSGAVQSISIGSPVDIQSLAWSNSGQLAYLYTNKQKQAMIAIAGSKAAPIDLSAHLPTNSQVSGLAFSPDGSQFAFTATDKNGNGEIYTINADGTGLHQLTKNIGAVVDYWSGTISWR